VEKSETDLIQNCVARSRVFAVTNEALQQELRSAPREIIPVTVANAGLPFEHCMVVPSEPTILDPKQGEFLAFAFLLVEGDLGCLALAIDLARPDMICSAEVIEYRFIKAVTTLIKLPQSTAVLTPGQRYAWKATSKSKALPTPYYTVDWAKTRKTLSSAPAPIEETVEEDNEDVHRFLKYRHDRSAHRRLHVRRVMGTFDAIKHTCLVKRGFVVYGPDDILGPVSSDHLARRGHPPKQHGETIALRVSDIRQTIVGKPDLPYIPAVRAVGSNVI
jgi:hypothetical protein